MRLLGLKLNYSCVYALSEVKLTTEVLTPEGDQEEYYEAVQISGWLDPDFGPLLCESSS